MWLSAWVLSSAFAAPDGASAVSKALSARHAIECEVAEALSTEPVAALEWVVDHVEAPPWAGIRAARCLARRHPEAVQASLRAWLTDPARKGLGRVVVAELDHMPLALAESLATTAMEQGTEPTRTARTLRRLEHPSLRAIAGPR